MAVAVVAPLAVPSEPASAQTADASSTSATTLQVLDQSTWIAPGQTFDLSMGVHSRVPQSELGIALSVYAPPIGQSSFDAAIAGDTSEEELVSDTPTVPFSSLSVSGDDVELQAPIAAGNIPLSDNALALDLECQSGNCNGVYPVRVQLMDTATGNVLANIITFIVFVEATISSRLRVSLVVPVGAAPATPGPGGTIGKPSKADMARLSSLVSELSGTSSPITVLPEPETVQALRSANSSARDVSRSISSLSSHSNVEVLPSPYVWIDPTVLRIAGLVSDIAQQIGRGRSVLSAAKVQTSGTTSVIETTLDEPTLRQLEDGATTGVVVPSGTLTAVTGRYDGPCVQTFSIPDGAGHAVDAAVTDPSLESQLEDKQGAGGVLAAHQLLADLSLIALEEPEASWIRGVALAPGFDWAPTGQFLSTFLSGLTSIPVLDPVTMSAFFSQVDKGDDQGNVNNGNGWPATRQLQQISVPVTIDKASVAFAGAISGARTMVRGLVSIVGSGESTNSLNDLLLSSESVQLTDQEQMAVVTTVRNVVSGRTNVVALSADHNIRLTAQNATIPITLVRQVSFPVTVEVDLSSDKLQFLHGTNPKTVFVTQNVQTVDIDVFARTSGDFPVLITVKSPTGDLTIASAKFTVRSLSSSVVAVVLTAGAAAVLLAWWGRTLLTGRRSRKTRPARGQHVASRHRDEVDGESHTLDTTPPTGARGAGASGGAAAGNETGDDAGDTVSHRSL